jgi:hypothetical protein
MHVWSPLRSALLALAFLPFAAAAQTTPQAPIQPKQFNGPDGHFSVMMPGTPLYESQNVPLKGGVQAQMNEWYVETEDHTTSYMLMYNDYPPNYANGAPADVLIRFREGATADKTLLTDQVIALNGIPGRAFTAKDKDGWLYDVHHYFLNKRLYQLIVVTAPGYTAAFRDQFMNSFQIR